MPIIDVIQMELLLQQTYVLVDAYVLVEGGGVDGDVLLAHGFDEAYFWEAFLEAGH